MNNIAKFLLGVKQEALQVSWASKNEVIGFLFIVILIITFMSVLFCCVDFLFLKLIKIVLGVIYEI
ncbi:preprotein translocase, SecE subunit [Ehrlichia chaffeensis str. Heartland]|uniref:Protein translocase subunit SecE n=1 Tax=Ehrlichia chaffeensis (strain ATCC CRL-10679 / Arkansas) TaxID=205920 RepID=Q2GFN7_EHRCR|nr:preprotein translocase subunit SecE [Ehrlichia chaffeensis]ABD44521.1 putative preprotein translocase, SecE subunit [Ehrlichia chaffeensis str. Arkansas]AHX03978.1 preprotein translocase, SecE subunit [Ehrlichia chaffeensis str. Heartland]AHX05289.1 preprotein translocase, SecE subunit [Ehrlichia chaffeensis str. Jax]AHX06277.1 preprotein translocase, SecE subunit [Ehrlichia chaffeensis str. Liberty]AHX07467.1 preprotein translocase, SecE subunit [Ehrlichia chaffeensis str. Osceola]